MVAAVGVDDVAVVGMELCDVVRRCWVAGGSWYGFWPAAAGSSRPLPPGSSCSQPLLCSHPVALPCPALPCPLPPCPLPPCPVPGPQADDANLVPAFEALVLLTGTAENAKQAWQRCGAGGGAGRGPPGCMAGWSARWGFLAWRGGEL